MAAGSSKSTPKTRKRVDATSPAAATLVRARDGSAFAKCEECNRDVPVALISMHSCSLDAKIKMNLEAQVVEMPAEAKKNPVEKKRSTSTEPEPKKTEPKPKRLKKLKKGADPSAPKRPQTAFFLFMEDFRKSHKEENPDGKGGKEVTTKGGEKWKLMTEEEKKLYIDRAVELKAEYEKAMVAWKEENGTEDDKGASNKEEGSHNGSPDKEALAKEEDDLNDYA